MKNNSSSSAISLEAISLMNYGKSNTVFSKQQIALLLIFIFAFSGNMILAYTLLRMKRKQKKLIDNLTLHLAMMDLLLVLFSIPEMLITEAFSGFMLGWVGCKTIHPLSTFAATASALTLLGIAFERYRVLQNQMMIDPKLQRHLLIIAIDAASAVIVLPYAFTLTYIPKTVNKSGDSFISIQGSTCVESWSIASRKTYTLTLFLSQYAMPAICMIWCYYIGWRNIWSSTRHLISNSVTGKMSRASSSLYSFRKISKRYSKADLKKEPQSKALLCRHLQCKKMTKKFTLILMVFLIFALPNQVLWVYMDFFASGSGEIDGTIVNISYMLTFANCFLNPLIYGQGVLRRNKNNNRIKRMKNFKMDRNGLNAA